MSCNEAPPGMLELLFLKVRGYPAGTEFVTAHRGGEEIAALDWPTVAHVM